MTLDWTVDSPRPWPERICVDGVEVPNVFEVHVGADGTGEVWAYGTPDEAKAKVFRDGDADFISVRLYNGKVDVEWPDDSTI